MIEIYCGTDTVLARQALNEKCKTENLVPQFLEEGKLPDPMQGSNLFSSPEFLVCKNILKNTDDIPQALSQWIEMEASLCLLESNITPANAQIKKLQEMGVKIKFFNAPSTPNIWLQKRIEIYGSKISLELATKVVKKLGIDLRKTPTEINLWRLEQEAIKITTYCQKTPVNTEAVELLVCPSEEPFFSVVDNLLKKDPAETLLAYEKLYERSNQDETTLNLQLCAGLGELLRNARVYAASQQEKISEASLASELKWPAWKLSKAKQAARSFSLRKIYSNLEKLLLLDAEIKTSGLPAKPILNLILVELLTKP